MTHLESFQMYSRIYDLLFKDHIKWSQIQSFALGFQIRHYDILAVKTSKENIMDHVVGMHRLAIFHMRLII